MNIVFWGTPDFAAYVLRQLIKSEYNVVGIVTQPDRKRGRGNSLISSPVKQIGEEYGIQVIK